MIIGHRKIIDFFARARESGGLAHTYCFVGPAQVGKRAVARHIAAELLGAKEEIIETHPDFHYVARLEDEKTGKLKKELSVAQAREIRGKLQRKSWLGGYQVMLIDEAELLNEESANALLKTLEEPPERSLIILLTENDLALPATIRSRSQCFYFSLVSEAEIVRGLEESGFPSSDAQLAATLAWGKPGRAVELAQSLELRTEQLNEIERWQKLLGQPFYSKLKMIEDAFGDPEKPSGLGAGKGDTIRTRERLQDILDTWILEWRKVALIKNGVSKSDSFLEPVARRFSQSELREIIDTLSDAKKFLSKNIHPRLLVEQALFNF